MNKLERLTFRLWWAFYKVGNLMRNGVEVLFSCRAILVVSFGLRLTVR